MYGSTHNSSTSGSACRAVHACKLIAEHGLGSRQCHHHVLLSNMHAASHHQPARCLQACYKPLLQALPCPAKPLLQALYPASPPHQLLLSRHVALRLVLLLLFLLALLGNRLLLGKQQRRVLLRQLLGSCRLLVGLLQHVAAADLLKQRRQLLGAARGNLLDVALLAGNSDGRGGAGVVSTAAGAAAAQERPGQHCNPIVSLLVSCMRLKQSGSIVMETMQLMEASCWTWHSQLCGC